MSRIQRKIIVFALAITFWGKAHAATSISNGIQNTNTTQNQTESKETLSCSDVHVEYRNAAEAAYKAFNDLVNITVNYSSKDKRPYTTKFNQSLNQFLEDSVKYCSGNQTITDENFKDYLDVVEFGLSNVTVLKDLEKDGSLKCILSQKSEIIQCVKDYLNEDITKHTNYSRLHSKSHLDFNLLACTKAKYVNSCVLKVIEDNCDTATNYVERLFNFVLDKHCEEDMPETDASVKITGHWSLYIVGVSLVLYTSILSLFH